jgi:hypothetical protein
MNVTSKTSVMEKDDVYDQINHQYKLLELVATHNESKAPLYICREILTEDECNAILDVHASGWNEHHEVTCSGVEINKSHVQQQYLQSSSVVLQPVISQLKEIAPNWSMVTNSCMILKYGTLGAKSLHTDSSVELFAPSGVTVDDSNRYKYLTQATLFIYLNTVDVGEGGVTNFYNTDKIHPLRPIMGLGVLHPCISATHESSLDKFAKLNTSSTSVFPTAHARNEGEYRVRDTGWCHESTTLLKGEKYIIACPLVDHIHCDLDTPQTEYADIWIRYDERSAYLFPPMLSSVSTSNHSITKPR